MHGSTRYTQKELTAEARRMARERGGRLLFWEVVVGESHHTALVVHYETKIGGKGSPVQGAQKSATNMVL